MELWVRNQDKTRLTKVNDLYVVGYGNDWAIDGYYTNSVDDFDLGVYSTKERALEVLDEIESLLNDETVETEIRYVDNQEYERIVTRKPNIPKTKTIYQMPED